MTGMNSTWVKPRRWTYSAREGRQFPVGERAVALFGHPAPGAQVHLVDRHGARPGHWLGGARPSRRRRPTRRPGPRRWRGGARRAFVGKGKGEGVGLVHLVKRLFGGLRGTCTPRRAQGRDEALPDAGLGPWAKGWLPLSQALKVAAVTQSCAASGPTRQSAGPLPPRASLSTCGSQLMVQAVVVAFVEEIEIVVGRERDVVPHRVRGSVPWPWSFCLPYV